VRKISQIGKTLTFAGNLNTSLIASMLFQTRIDNAVPPDGFSRGVGDGKLGIQIKFLKIIYRPYS